MHTTGTELRAERAAAYLTVTQVAKEMGVHRNTVAALEKPRVVSDERAAAYRDAVARLRKAAA